MKDLVDHLESEFEEAKESAKDLGAAEEDIQKVKMKKKLKKPKNSKKRKAADASAKALLG